MPILDATFKEKTTGDQILELLDVLLPEGTSPAVKRLIKIRGEGALTTFLEKKFIVEVIINEAKDNGME